MLLQLGRNESLRGRAQVDDDRDVVVGLASAHTAAEVPDGGMVRCAASAVAGPATRDRHGGSQYARRG